MTEIFLNAGALLVGLFALVSLLIGALLVSLGLFTLQRHRAAAGWPQVPGVVETSEVVAERRFKHRAVMYRPVVRYRYGAPGGVYLGGKVASTARLYNREKEAQRIAARYPVGTTVMVRYNPGDPSEAVLERGRSGGIWLLLFGLLTWLFPVAAGLAAGLSGWTIGALLAGLALVLTGLMLTSGSSLARARSRGLLPPAGNCSDADVLALAGRGERRLAIRLYRELHGGGLREARRAIEALAGDTGPDRTP